MKKELESNKKLKAKRMSISQQRSVFKKKDEKVVEKKDHYKSQGKAADVSALNLQKNQKSKQAMSPSAQSSTFSVKYLFGGYGGDK